MAGILAGIKFCGFMRNSMFFGFGIKHCVLLCAQCHAYALMYEIKFGGNKNTTVSSKCTSIGRQCYSAKYT